MKNNSAARSVVSVYAALEWCVGNLLTHCSQLWALKDHRLGRGGHGGCVHAIVAQVGSVSSHVFVVNYIQELRGGLCLGGSLARVDNSGNFLVFMTTLTKLLLFGHCTTKENFQM